MEEPFADSATLDEPSATAVENRTFASHFQEANAEEDDRGSESGSDRSRLLVRLAMVSPPEDSWRIEGARYMPQSLLNTCLTLQELLIHIAAQANDFKAPQQPRAWGPPWPTDKLRGGRAFCKLETVAVSNQ
eukprot:5680619-Amphidinium_carterae.1